LDLELAVGASRGDRIVTLENLSVEVPGRTLFHISEIFLRPGERVVLLGNNGTGKTTLIRQLVHTFAEQKSGVKGGVIGEEIRFSPQAQLGYYDQELQQASTNLSLFDFVARDIVREDQAIVQTLVGAGFAFAAHTTPISALSGGERARALFVRLSLARPNFLILDEPTNHIDIEGREQLETQLLASTAAVLFTSHDRAFVQALAQRFLVIEDGELREYQDADKFFAGALSSKEQVEPKAPAQASSALQVTDEDALLERIEELETKLSADVARKPKFQKPQLQLQWRTELAELYERLE
jgi:ATPase subunit of ABC transporter with duplicated ATPase domains